MTPAEFVKAVTLAYENDIGIFKNKVNAEDLIPHNASGKEKSLYLFYVIQLDYATRSQRLYDGAKRLFESERNFFKPTYILSLPQKKLEKYLTEYFRPRYINEAVRRFRKNSQLLNDDYNSDPQNIFLKSKSASEVLKRVGEFRGFGPKIGNFFVRTMINTFDYKFSDVEEILPPVDVWDVRIACLMGFVESDKMSSVNIRTVKEVWSKACRDAKVSWLTFDKALWLLGSEGRPKNGEEVLELIHRNKNEMTLMSSHLS
ncbi:hypothetical protein A2886_02290 [candidate division WWE3 bacterium RIFCSPHIGHO2_01_FULL_42_13]|uniref:HhH-GPD domain-containing protein n=1 Tax=candidate division WWE3 bacterium RIFCSPHIGHO2_01_FULL_42_13 TaxID=1802617 RepID=A0A1F4UTR9_UNCKA|nr:MAG: hypothetical protein A2886_02290 [candidate division WWE3 bacterium RIFCSPHIGHO2_01_FULL_42_13]